MCGSPEHPAPARLLPDDGDPASELETAEAAEATARDALALAERATGEARVLHQELARSLAALNPADTPGRLVDGIDTAGFDATAFAVALGDLAEAAVLEAALAAFNARLAAAQARANRAAAAAAAGPEPDMEGLQAARVAAEVELEALVRSQTRSEAEAQALSLARTRIAETLARQAAAEEAYRHVGALSSLAQGRNEMRMALVDYAMAAYFEDVLRAANIRFDRMSAGRFELRRKTTAQDQRSRSGLEIVVFDAHSGRERDAQTLSGGEGFLAALALALALCLSDVVQAEAGGVKLDAIFIDEGFGHLDDESLERALDTLRDMVGEARAVGVISHVDAVKTQIPAGFEVTPGPSGSQILARV